MGQHAGHAASDDKPVIPAGNGAAGPRLPANYEVSVVEPDPRRRMKLVMQLAGLAAATAHETIDPMLDEHREPRVVVLGPSFADGPALAEVERLATGDPTSVLVLVAEEITTEMLQRSLRAGVRDVVPVHGGEAPLQEAVGRLGAIVARGAAKVAVPDGVQTPGRVIVSFSTKGGVGKSMVAVNTGVALARRSKDPVVLVDADLQFGDVAVLLGIPPHHTVVDAAAAVHQDDQDLMRRLLTPHEPSGLLVLPAPVEPSAADQVRPEDMLAIVKSLQRFCGFVVLDMPPHFDDLVLALVETADDVLVVASMDLPSIKNLKVGMQTLDLLSMAGDKLRLVLNRANAKVRLDVKEVEAYLGLRAEFPVPSDIAVPQAVNRGVPVVLDNPRSGAARALEHIAETFVPGNQEPDDGQGRDRRRRRRPGRGEEGAGS
ncbi:MAG: P-loop NTPase [Acidimicrobiia bacterium]